MEVIGDYSRGYALYRGLVEPTVTTEFFKDICETGGITAQHLDLLGDNAEIAPRDRLRRQTLWGNIPTEFDPSPVGNRQVASMHSHGTPILRAFQYGLVPAISEFVGAALEPTYAYFRIYQKGDVCRVHADRPHCDHSLSLTLAYSDDLDWPLEVGTAPVEPGQAIKHEDNFGDEPSRALSMEPGDAVAYRGEIRRHGRTRPNPNRWSAHLFLHFIEKNGRYSDLAFRP